MNKVMTDRFESLLLNTHSTYSSMYNSEFLSGELYGSGCY